MDKSLAANKRLGQHFLHNSHIVSKIVSDYPSDTEVILEIGPGKGVLTKELVKLNTPFHVIEKDKRFADVLVEYMSEENIHIEDVLNMDMKGFISDIGAADKRIWIVSNLPYNVGTPIVTGLISYSQISYMTVMLQKEVADKILGVGKKNTMSSLFALMQNYFSCRLLTKVAPGNFNPPPKIESAVLSLSRLEGPVVPLTELASYERFLRSTFAFKRKQLLGTLNKEYSGHNWEAVFSDANIERTARAESLNIDEIRLLYNYGHQDYSKK